MRKGVFAFLGGILLLQSLPTLPARSWCLLLLLIVPLSFFSGSRWRPLLLAAAGFLWVLWHAGTILATALPMELEGRDVIVEGIVSEIPRRRERGMTLYLDVQSMSLADQAWPVPGLVRLNWYGRVSRLQAGERWRLRVRLKRPHGFMNPGGFDYEGWLFRQGIRATGYVRQDRDNRRLAAAPAFSWGRLRQVLHDAISRQLAGHPFKGMILALAMGERQDVGAEQWAVLRRTGTSHLMAISGLHIGLVAGLCFLLLRRLWSCSATLSLRLAAPQAAALGALAAALLYAALAGFSIPTQRALIMVALAMMAVFVQCRWRPADVLALALWGVLLLDPLAVMAVGFWLSFTAVAVILFAMGGRAGPQGRGRQWGRLHWVVALGLAPLSLLFFQQQPLLAPLANVLAVPWVSLLVVPLVLLGACLLAVLPALGGSLLALAATLLSWLWPVLEWLAALPLGQWLQAPPLWAVLAALPGIALLLSPRGLPGRWTGIGWLLPLFLVAPARPPEQTLWFTLLDVGQGLAAVARTRDHVLVYDSGPRFSARFDAGAAVIVPFLRQQGIHHVDTLVLGHGDNDHIGGAASLLKEISVGRVISSVPEKVPWQQAAPCRAGQIWRWNGVAFRILHPLPDGDFQGNDASCVLQISSARRAILLTGDIEYRAEQALVRQYGGQLAAQVLVVPHHGSRTSSSAAFLDAVAPAYGLFPVGYRNRYGFPAAPVLERYRSRGIRLLDSARHGAISFVLDGRAGLSFPAAYRVTARRYWHGG